MRISTKTGDAGLTQWRSSRISKNSQEIRLLGFLDRAMAETAMAAVTARQNAVDEDIQDALFHIHSILSDVCAVLAADAQKDLMPALLWCDHATMNASFDGFVNFCQSSPTGAAINLARTAVRLAESHLDDACDEQNPLLRPLINRLSDVLFVLATRAD